MNLDQVIEFFKGGSLAHFAKVLFQMGGVLELLDDKYIQDHNAKNALIDTLIETLQKHKSGEKNGQENA